MGAFACLLLLVLINRRNGVQPERILLSGIAITALFEPLQAIALANGDLRVQQLLSGCPAPPITSPSRWPLPWWCWRC